MSTEIRWRRGTTVQHSTFTGAPAEVTVDTDKNAIVVHDGATPGGFPITPTVGLQDQIDDIVNTTYTETEVDAFLVNKLNKNGSNIGTATEQAAFRSAINAAAKLEAQRNLIVNGSMFMSQENGNTLGIVDGYFPADQFNLSFTAATAAMSVQRIQARTLANALDQIEFKTTTTKAVLSAGDSVTITQSIEGSAIVSAGFGTATAKPLVLRAQVQLPAGLYHFHFQNAAANRHCAVPFTVTGGEANTAVVKEIVVPADTTGTWSTAEGTIGLTVDLVLAVGTTKTGGTASTWGASTFLAASTQFNILSSTSNVARLADVGLKLDLDSGGFYGAYRINEVDAIYRSERYLPSFFSTGTVSPFGSGQAFNGTQSIGIVEFKVQPAKVPTNILRSATAHFTVSSASGASIVASGISLSQASRTSAWVAFTVAGGLVAGNQAPVYFNNAAGFLLFTGCRL